MTIESTELIDKDEHIEQASRALKAMSHPLRLKILCVLGDKEVSVQDIVDNVGTSQSNISLRLWSGRILTASGLSQSMAREFAMKSPSGCVVH